MKFFPCISNWNLEKASFIDFKTPPHSTASSSVPLLDLGWATLYVPFLGNSSGAPLPSPPPADESVGVFLRSHRDYISSPKRWRCVPPFFAEFPDGVNVGHFYSEFFFPCRAARAREFWQTVFPFFPACVTVPPPFAISVEVRVGLRVLSRCHFDSKPFFFPKTHRNGPFFFRMVTPPPSFLYDPRSDCHHFKRPFFPSMALRQPLPSLIVNLPFLNLHSSIALE